ncbi:MAG: TatD family hydrolase [Acidiferrobacterales bacterium]
MSLLVDSHCHINFDPLGNEVPDVLARARDNDVGYFLCVSVNLEDYPQVNALANQYENVFASVGVHPNEQEGQDPDEAELSELAKDKNVIAIGETGLDYFRSTGELDWQHNRFRQHIRAAIHSNMPLIIHTREAASDTIRIMKEEGAEKCGGVMHCFAENWEVARQALELGFYISFSGIVTFNSAKDLKEVAKLVPEDRMLVETDSPYLAPTPHRGKTNEPAYVKHVAECIAELRGTTYENIAELTTGNFFKLFARATA